MLNREYGKEPFDLHLFILLFFRKIWVVIFVTIVGGILIGGGYYLKNIAFAPMQKYEMVSDTYLDYAKNELGEEYTYFNQTTWESLIYADEIIDPLVKIYNISKDQLKQNISATLLSDTRILTTTVEGYDKEMVEELNQALLQSLSAFAETKKEFVAIDPIRVPETASLQDPDIRLWNATILGMVVGFLIAGFGVALYNIWDDKIYLPTIFEKRYQIPVIKNIKGSVEGEKYTYIRLDKDRIPKQDEIDRKTETNLLINNPFWDEAAMEQIKKKERYILVISSKVHNSKLLEATLEILDKKEGIVVGAILYDQYEKLQKMYYFPGSQWIKKQMK